MVPEDQTTRRNTVNNYRGGDYGQIMYNLADVVIFGFKR
jgi:hypothetical protein